MSDQGRQENVVGSGPEAGAVGTPGMALAVLGVVAAAAAAGFGASAAVVIACLGPVVLGAALAQRAALGAAREEQRLAWAQQRALWTEHLTAGVQHRALETEHRAVELAHRTAEADHRAAEAEHRTLVSELAGRGDGLPAASEALTRGAQVLAELGERLEREHAECASALGELVGTVRAEHAAHAEQMAALGGLLGESLRDAVAAGVEKASDTATAGVADALAASVGPQLETALDELGEGLGAHLSLIRDGARREAEARETLRASLGAEQRAEMEKLLERLEALDATRREAHADLVERLDADTSRLRDEAEVREARLATIWEDAAGTLASGLEGALARDEARANVLFEQAEAVQTRLGALGAQLDALAAKVDDAAGLVHGGGAELTAAAELFATAVGAHADAAREWQQALGSVDDAILDAGERAAVDVLGEALGRTHELFDQQLAFHEALLGKLDGGVAEGAPTLVGDVAAGHDTQHGALAAESEGEEALEVERDAPVESAVGLIDAPDADSVVDDAAKASA